MATPDTTLITRAEVNSITTASTGRKALVLDGSTIEIGDTGWRDLSGSLNTLVSSGRILVRRQAGTITWNFVGIVLASGASQAQNLFGTVPANLDSFFPDHQAQTAVKANATQDGRFTVLSSGSPRLDYATPTTGYSGLVSFPVRGTGTWPGTLPGVADGQPVGV